MVHTFLLGYSVMMNLSIIIGFEEMESHSVMLLLVMSLNIWKVDIVL